MVDQEHVGSPYGREVCTRHRKTERTPRPPLSASASLCILRCPQIVSLPFAPFTRLLTRILFVSLKSLCSVLGHLDRSSFSLIVHSRLACCLQSSLPPQRSQSRMLRSLGCQASIRFPLCWPRQIQDERLQLVDERAKSVDPHGQNSRFQDNQASHPGYMHAECTARRLCLPTPSEVSKHPCRGFADSTKVACLPGAATQRKR